MWFLAAEKFGRLAVSPCSQYRSGARGISFRDAGSGVFLGRGRITPQDHWNSFGPFGGVGRLVAQKSQRFLTCRFLHSTHSLVLNRRARSKVEMVGLDENIWGGQIS
ncbi:MAG: hypothetical protein Ct9H300mP26_1600 [Acidimicrobiales bacterium]|nr:MAG: hypothetical protein Ct9H300mP26_1600 [Acidimicrobiales bacterium]